MFRDISSIISTSKLSTALGYSLAIILYKSIALCNSSCISFISSGASSSSKLSNSASSDTTVAADRNTQSSVYIALGSLPTSVVCSEKSNILSANLWVISTISSLYSSTSLFFSFFASSSPASSSCFSFSSFSFSFFSSSFSASSSAFFFASSSSFFFSASFFAFSFSLAIFFSSRSCFICSCLASLSAISASVGCETIAITINHTLNIAAAIHFVLAAYFLFFHNMISPIGVINTSINHMNHSFL